MGGRQDLIINKGKCPEGSKCKCPMTKLRSRDTTADIRKMGANVFVTQGIASVPNLMEQAATGLLVTAMVKAVLAGKLLTYGLVSALKIPYFLAGATLKLGVKALMEYSKFQCKY